MRASKGARVETPGPLSGTEPTAVGVARSAVPPAAGMVADRAGRGGGLRTRQRPAPGPGAARSAGWGSRAGAPWWRCEPGCRRRASAGRVRRCGAWVRRGCGCRRRDDGSWGCAATRWRSGWASRPAARAPGQAVVRAPPRRRSCRDLPTPRPRPGPPGSPGSPGSPVVELVDVGGRPGCAPVGVPGGACSGKKPLGCGDPSPGGDGSAVRAGAGAASCRAARGRAGVDGRAGVGRR